MDPRARERAECRRPIEAGEIPLLEALAARLLELRRAAGLTRWELAQGAKLSENTIARIELGTRRTRATTLERIAQALGEAAVVRELIELARPRACARVAVCRPRCPTSRAAMAARVAPERRDRVTTLLFGVDAQLRDLEFDAAVL